MNKKLKLQMVFDARGNGGGGIAPTITGDHQDRITDYTAIVLEVWEEDMEDWIMATGQANAEIMRGGVSDFKHN